MTAFTPLLPWRDTTRAAVAEIAANLAPMDAREILAVRPKGTVVADLVDEVALIVASGAMLDGFLAWDARARPVACAFAYASQLPKVCNVVVFGVKGGGRAGRAVYDELARRASEFGREFDMRMVQVPVLEDHTVARKLIRRVGGREVFEYGPIGQSGERFIHVIWVI